MRELVSQVGGDGDKFSSMPAKLFSKTRMRVEFFERVVVQNFDDLSNKVQICHALGKVLVSLAQSDDAEEARTILEYYDGFTEHIAQHLTIFWQPEGFWDISPFDQLAWRDHPRRQGYPIVIFRKDEWNETLPHPSPCMELLEGQKVALKSLMNLYRAKKEKISAGGFVPRYNALLYGPSGSGKTFVARQLAISQNLDIFEQGAASWIPNGARDDTPSPVKLSKFVAAHEAGIIFFDEVEKAFPPDFSKAIPWERYCADEIMAILDAKVERWSGWNRKLARKLDEKFFIIVAGAWQHAYEQAFTTHKLLGGDWSNLSIADTFLESNHLPKELLARVSAMAAEVTAPTPTELAHMLEKVREDLGFDKNPEEIKKVALEIMEDQIGVRGVEKYLLKLWVEKTEGRSGAFHQPDLFGPG